MVKKPKIQGEYRGVYYESAEELAFLMWAFELKDVNYIASIQRASSFDLSASYKTKYTETKHLKTKVRVEEKFQTLLNGHIYTPEYRIVWNQKGVEAFVNWGEDSKYTKSFIGHWEEDTGRVTYIEVKPIFDQNNMTRLFKINQKWMWDKYEVFVNLVIPQELFGKTFTPQVYLKTPTGKDRKITKWKVKSLNEFINENRNK